MKGSILKIKDISFSYDKKREVLNNICFSLNNKEILVVAGPNGSGKTTLIKLIFDLLEKQKGEILIEGLDNCDIKAKSKIMYLPSDNIIPDFLTGSEYISLMCKMYDKQIDNELLERLVEYYSMNKSMDSLMEGYSHGMIKKVQLIAAFLIQPDIVIVDETLNGIDLEAKEVSKVLLHKLTNKGKSVIMCTHDLDLAEEIGDRAVLIYKGKVYKEIDLKDNIKEKSLTSIFKEVLKFEECNYEI